MRKSNIQLHSGVLMPSGAFFLAKCWGDDCFKGGTEINEEHPRITVVVLQMRHAQMKCCWYGVIGGAVGVVCKLECVKCCLKSGCDVT